VPTTTKFTPETRAKIILCISCGMSRQSACAHTNITRKTLNAWEKLAAEDEEYRRFVEEMQLAQDQAQGRLEAIVNAKSTGTTVEGVNVEKADLRALQFQLQCGGTRPWAEIKQVEVTGKNSGPVEHTDKASVQIGAALAELAAKVREHDEAARSCGGAGASKE
jgi:hypothetical protein